MLVLLVWVLLFFRDPYRETPKDDSILLSPADGKITDIEIIDEPDFIGGKALRIGIFLSVFNVHINRSPCEAIVEGFCYKKGKYKNALYPESARVNESNAVYLRRVAQPEDRLVVRQISGAIARRIVCKAQKGAVLRIGEKFGMIKFGSRTELYLCASETAECMVKKGQKVKAGLTVMVKYKIAEDIKNVPDEANTVDIG